MIQWCKLVEEIKEEVLSNLVEEFNPNSGGLKAWFVDSTLMGDF